MFYSFRNCKILVNELPIFANSFVLSSEASIEAVVHQGKNYPDRYSSSDGLIGSIKMSYYLTGRDFLKDYISNNNQYLDISVGGLNIKTGILTSYSIDAQPNSPVIANASISFFNTIYNNFSPSYETLPSIIPLNFSDCTVSGVNIGEVSQLTSVRYNADLPVDTSYVDKSKDSISPDSLVYGLHNVTIDVEYDNLTGNLCTSGSDGQIIINLRSSDLSTQDTINVSGKIFRKDISVGVGNVIKSSISIKKNTVIPPPTITSFSPLTGVRNSTLVTLYGTNLKTTHQVYYGKNLSKISPITSDDRILFIPRLEAKTGFFTVITQGGVAIATTPFISSGVPIGGF